MGAAEVRFENKELFERLAGPGAQNLAVEGERLGLTLTTEVNASGGHVRLTGLDHDVEVGARLLRDLYFQVRKGRPLHPSNVTRVLDSARKGHVENLDRIFDDALGIRLASRTLLPKTANQRAYDEAEARTPSTRPRRRRSDHPA